MFYFVQSLSKIFTLEKFIGTGRGHEINRQNMKEMHNYVWNIKLVKLVNLIVIHK